MKYSGETTTAAAAATSITRLLPPHSLLCQQQNNNTLPVYSIKLLCKDGCCASVISQWSPTRLYRPESVGMFRSHWSKPRLEIKSSQQTAKKADLMGTTCNSDADTTQYTEWIGGSWQILTGSSSSSSGVNVSVSRERWKTRGKNRSYRRKYNTIESPQSRPSVQLRLSKNERRNSKQ